MIDYSSEPNPDFYVNICIYIITAFVYMSLLDYIVLKMISDERKDGSCGYGLYTTYDLKRDLCEQAKKHAYKRFAYTTMLALISILIGSYVIFNDVSPVYDHATAGVVLGSIIIIVYDLFFVLWDVNTSDYKLFVLIMSLVMMFSVAPMFMKNI